MKFREAFEAMKSGAKVKLPGWGGYWYWDPKKETVMIKCLGLRMETKEIF